MKTINRVSKTVKQTDNRFLNMFELTGSMRNGGEKTYFMASRSASPEDLKLHFEEKPADAVMMYGICGDKIVLERQYRYTIDDFIYECPAGLLENGEQPEEAAVREFYEETGMSFTPYTKHSSSRPYYPSIGVTDESIITIFGRAEGEPTAEHQEESEDIHVVLADREECRRILREENVSMLCAFLLFCFLAADDGDPFAFLV